MLVPMPMLMFDMNSAGSMALARSMPVQPPASRSDAASVPALASKTDAGSLPPVGKLSSEAVEVSSAADVSELQTAAEPEPRQSSETGEVESEPPTAKGSVASPPAEHDQVESDPPEVAEPEPPAAIQAKYDVKIQKLAAELDNIEAFERVATAFARRHMGEEAAASVRPDPLPPLDSLPIVAELAPDTKELEQSNRRSDDHDATEILSHPVASPVAPDTGVVRKTSSRWRVQA